MCMNVNAPPARTAPAREPPRLSADAPGGRHGAHRIGAQTLSAFLMLVSGIGLNVAYIGGTDANGHPVDNRTPQQREALRHIVTLLRAQYPKAMVCGHRDLSPDLDGNGRIEPWEYVKACPCFDAVKEYATV